MIQNDSKRFEENSVFAENSYPKPDWATLLVVVVMLLGLGVLINIYLGVENRKLGNLVLVLLVYCLVGLVGIGVNGISSIVRLRKSVIQSTILALSVAAVSFWLIDNTQISIFLYIITYPAVIVSFLIILSDFLVPGTLLRSSEDELAKTFVNIRNQYFIGSLMIILSFFYIYFFLKDSTDSSIRLGIIQPIIALVGISPLVAFLNTGIVWQSIQLRCRYRHIMKMNDNNYTPIIDKKWKPQYISMSDIEYLENIGILCTTCLLTTIYKNTDGEISTLNDTILKNTKVNKIINCAIIKRIYL